MSAAPSMQVPAASNTVATTPPVQPIDDLLRVLNTMPSTDLKRLQKAIRELLGLDRPLAGDNSDVVSVRLPPRTLRAMNFVATARRVSLSAILRDAIQSYRPRELR